jgi:hypothetical protein
LPILKKSFLGHNNALDFNGSFLKGVAGGSGLFLLRNELRLVESFLLIQPLDFFIHVVNEQILFLLGLLEITNVFLSTVGGAASKRNLAFHNLVVLFDLLQSAVQLVQFLLGLQHAF